MNKGDKAVIWDLDGVIADTSRYHFRAWRKLAQEEGKELSFEDFRRHFGRRNVEIIRDLFGGRLSPGEVASLAQRKEDYFRQEIGQNIKPHPGARELLESLKRAGFKLALASSAPRQNIQLLTQALRITNLFKAIVANEDVTQGKPHPEVFLTAAQRLGVDPSRCLVIEDAITGVTAAKAARMRCIAVTNTQPRERLGEADLVVESLEAVEVEDVERLVTS